MSEINYAWREAITPAEMDNLVRSRGGEASHGWWERTSARSLGWVSARDSRGLLVGFVNVAWDGDLHAFLLDTKIRGSHQHRGIGTKLVAHAVENAQRAGCEWLHVDFEPELEDFYLHTCNFRPTPAGLIHLGEPAV